jgi:hypothetical protein
MGCSPIATIGSELCWRAPYVFKKALTIAGEVFEIGPGDAPVRPPVPQTVLAKVEAAANFPCRSIAAVPLRAAPGFPGAMASGRSRRAHATP